MATFEEKCFERLAVARQLRGGTLHKEEWLAVVRKCYAEEKPVKVRRTPCSPPMPAEVTAYSEEIGYPLDGEGWCDCYAQKGWMAGKVPMKDWRAAVRNWKRNKWTVGAVTTNEVSLTASLGALQLQLKATEEELTGILYPGGAAFKTVPTGARLDRANFLAAQRKKLKERIEAA